jgi:hypothetical protein
MTVFTLSRRLASLLVGAAALAAAVAGSGPAATTYNYVALGDSFSSGVGTASYTVDGTCKRSVYAYPYLYWQKHPGTSLTFVACSGAKTSDLIANQLSSVTKSTNLVTMTIGGNDIGFANLIYQCTLSDCSAALDATSANLDATLGDKLTAVFNAVKANAADGAKIVVLGYPKMFAPASCLGTLGISSTEQRKANDLAVALDTEMRSRLPAGVTYQSALGAFAGHAVCSSSPWLNGLNLFNTGESYHPNRGGHSSGYLPLVSAVAP